MLLCRLKKKQKNECKTSHTIRGQENSKKIGKTFSFNDIHVIMRITKLHLVLCIMLLCVCRSYSQGISVSAPSQVAVGENFRIAYTVNTQDVDDFRAGNIPAGIEVIAGPYQSVQRSIQMINGRTSSSSSITFTYTLERYLYYTIGSCKS